MNRIFTTLLISSLAGFNLFAQINGNGYYRAVSYGLQSQTKQDYYCCVVHNDVHINTSALTNQVIDAIHLCTGDYVANSDPSTILYISDAFDSGKFTIKAQGCDLRSMLQPQSMSLKEMATGDYQIQATKQGTTLSLKNQTTMVNNHHYGCATGGNGHSYWKIYPVNSDSEYDWFGIQPTLEADGKYYASFFAGFPFKCKSKGMKVYYVSAADDEHYELKEITGEVPASTPVLIECSSKNPKENLIDILESSSVKITDNKLNGVYFCNQYLREGAYHGFITPFDEKSMRVWNVKDGKLVLSTAKEGLFEGTYKDIFGLNYIGKLFIKANSGYLPVSATAKSELTAGKTAINDVASSVSPTIVTITNITGQRIQSLASGVNLVRYSDGTVKKVIK